MGNCFSEETQIEPRELEDLNGADDGRKIEKNREVTDKFSFGLLAVYLVLFSCMVIYVAVNGDISRFFNGYDNCGNICGKTNKAVSGIDCSGKDMTNSKYLLVQNISHGGESWELIKECRQKCPDGYDEIFHRCVKNREPHEPVDLKTAFHDFTREMYEYWVEILLLCLLAVVYSIIMVVLFRYATKCVVWFMLIGGAIACLAFTIFLWIAWGQAKKEAESNSTYVDHDSATSILAGAIIASIFTVIVLVILIAMRKKIELVIQLLKETAKAIASMPLILFEPILTFISVTIGALIWLYFFLVAANAGSLQEVKEMGQTNTIYDYVDNGVVSFTIVLSILTALWMFYFMVDCQHMIIAGSVSRWFFTRNKNNLGSPILSSAITTVRYHLGTIALGSLIVTLFMIIKALIKGAIKSLTKGDNGGLAIFIKCCVNWCLETIEDLLKYFTRNAYIVTAIYGYSFCQAGKRAFHIISNNMFKIIAINSIGDFVLGLTKVFILIMTAAVGFEVMKGKGGSEDFAVFPFILVALFALCIGHMFMTVYEMAIDTIFICFCEDMEENDGLSKPYYMSKELMEFVEKSHKLLDKGESQPNETAAV